MNGFTVLPMSQEIRLEPGKSYRMSVKVANPADATGDFRYRATVMPYGVSGENYSADLTTMSAWSQMVEWITIDNPTGKVAPNEVEDVWFTIKVPKSVPAGGQYAAIGISADAGESSGSGVSINSVYELVSIVYADVAGETVHRGEVISNTIPGFVASGTPEVAAMVNNSGNTHENVTVAITVKNAITSEMLFPVGDEEGEFTDVILPETTKYLVRELDMMPSLGIYEVTQNITYLGGTSYNTQTLIMCPIWFMALTALTILAIIGTIIGMIIQRKRKKAVAFTD